VALLHDDMRPVLEALDGRLDARDLLLLRGVHLLLAQPPQLALGRVGGVVARVDRQPPAFQLRDLGGDLVQQIAIVRDDHHRAGVGLDEALQLALARQVEVIVRLIEQQHVGTLHRQPDERHQLFLPAAERLGRQGEIVLGEAQPGQHVAHGGRVARAAQPLVLVQRRRLPIQDAGQRVRIGVDVRIGQLRLEAGQPRVDLGQRGRRDQRLVQHGPARREPYLLGQIANGEAARPRHGPGVGDHLPGDGFEQAGLARPVGADQPHAGAVADGPAQVREDDPPGVVDGDVVELDDVHGVLLAVLVYRETRIKNGPGVRPEPSVVCGILASVLLDHRAQWFKARPRWKP